MGDRLGEPTLYIASKHVDVGYKHSKGTEHQTLGCSTRQHPL